MFNRKNLFLGLALTLFIPVFVSADCFSPGTLVQMADDSTKPIEKVEIGDEIVGYDVKTKEFTTNIVEELQSPVKPWVEIFLSDGTILNTTDDHPFFAKEHDYWASFDPDETWKNGQNIRVEQLEVGQHIMNSKEDFPEILDIKYHSEEIKTYNLKRVSNNNTFFADGFLAHNRDEGTSWCPSTSSEGSCSTACGYGTKVRTFTSYAVGSCKRSSGGKNSSCLEYNCIPQVVSTVTVGCIGTSCSGATSASSYVSFVTLTANINKSRYSPAENLKMTWAAQLYACANDFYSWAGWTLNGVVNGVAKTALSGGMAGMHIYSGVLDFTVQSSGGSYSALFGNLAIPYTVTAPIPTNNQPIGNHEAISCSNGKITTSGWAFDPDSKPTSIAIHFYEGSTPKGQCTASGSRPDVNSAYGITGNHGFSCSLLNMPVGNHSITAYAIDTAGGVNPVISNSPKTVNCPVANCTLPWGGTLANGGSVKAYSVPSVACGFSCTPYSQDRVCANGVLNGSFTNQNCSVNPCPCTTPWGTTVLSGNSVTAYNLSSVCNTSECLSESRACNNGTLYGTYTKSGCTKTNCTKAPACSLPPTYSCTGPENSQFSIYSDWWSDTCLSGVCDYKVTAPNFCGTLTPIDCGTEECKDSSVWKKRCIDNDIYKYQWGHNDSCSPTVAGCDIQTFYEECPGTETFVKTCEVGYKCKETGDNAECVAKSATWTEE